MLVLINFQISFICSLLVALIYSLHCNIFLIQISCLRALRSRLSRLKIGIQEESNWVHEE